MVTGTGLIKETGTLTIKILSGSTGINALIMDPGGTRTMAHRDGKTGEPGDSMKTTAIANTEVSNVSRMIKTGGTI
jgi:hypothetical protein